jgi:5-methylcytosine-specific restriction enzyme A
MPTRLLGPCQDQPCPYRRVPGSQYCAEHTLNGCSKYDRGRGSSTERGYGHTWRKLRLMVLRRDPLCVDPFKVGCVAASLHADHIIPKRAGGTDSLEDNLQGLCGGCHTRKTLLEQAVTFSPFNSTEDTPTMFTAAGLLITLWNIATAPPEARPIKVWPLLMSQRVRAGVGQISGGLAR